MIGVKEFITRLEQGYAEAFLCRGEDGRLYVVKSRLSGKASLIREWVCGCIARELGLPVPPFEFIYADHAQAGYSGNEQLAALAETPGFASRFAMQGSSGAVGLPLLNPADVADIPADLRIRILLFDWWVLNFDRSDDNPNLLWESQKKSLHVIDHNLALDQSPTDLFWSNHIFRADGGALSDPGFRASASAEMEAILSQVPQFWSDMPDGWTEVSDLTAGDVDTVLKRCRSDDFWLPL